MAVSGINLSSTSGLGLGTGINVQTTVDQLIAADSGPLQQAQTRESQLQQEQSVISNLGSLLSTLKASADKLKDVGGAFSGVVASSSNATVVSASADSSAAVGKHSIQVNSLASASSYYSASQSSATASVGAGSFTLQVGSNSPVTVTIASGQDTLAGIAQTINGLQAGVHAAVLNSASGARLSVVSDSTGTAADISITSDTIGLGWTKSSTGADASLQVDGVPLTSATNSVSGVLQGVTLNLSSVTTLPVTIDVEPDTQAATTAVQGFVDAYNSLMQAVNAQFTYDPAQKTAGILSGDPYLRELQQRLLSDASVTAGTGAYNTLSAVGVSLQNDGTLQLDQSALKNALSSNFADVESAFQSSGGLGRTLGEDLMNLADPPTGLMNADAKSVTDQLQAVSDQVQSFNDYLTTERQMLTDKYTQINVLLQQQPQEIAQIQAELGVKSAQ